MAKKESTIVVAGDITVDWFMYPVKASDEGENWRLYDAIHADVLPGGAALLTNFIEQALEGEDITVYGPNLPEKQEMRKISPDEVIHSNAMLGIYKVPGDKETEVLRIKEPLGYIGPPKDQLPSRNSKLGNSNADIIVLDDAGNGFREVDDVWPKTVDLSGDPIIVTK